jgi:adenylate kinase
MGRKIVILLGHPGAGKGTQAKEIMRRLSIPQISTGDMLRDAIARQTSFGKEAKEKMDSGDLVSDDIVNGIVAERITHEDCQTGFILDGYPRTVQQAETFQKEMKPGDQIFVIEIFAEDSAIIDRLVGRLMCPGCGEIYNVVSRVPHQLGVCDRCGKTLVRRSDDREDLIVERFRHYREETYPLVEHYEKAGCYFQVDGMRPISEVTKDILGIVDCEEVLAPTPKGGKGSIA